MKPTISTMLFATALSLAATTVAFSATFDSLTGNGFKVGKMSKNAAGNVGWLVSNGKEKYFCNSNVSMAFVGKNGLVSMLSSGRLIELDRKTFEQSASTTGLPKLADLKAGKLRAEDVGSCAKAR